LLVALKVVKVEFVGIVQVRSNDPYFFVVSPPRCNAKVSVNGDGQNETFVIVRVFTNQIDPAWGNRRNFGRCPERRMKDFSGSLK
jgi:hypothetical protein